ncbi:MAG TPA: hypothetical protein PKJ83_13270 [Cyclobacteriaceae bacterium]|nr:hypothetical protein [Cyclobacteriaceae bacterium]
METENVRMVARFLDQKADDLDDKVGSLKRARSRLGNAWSGGSREKRFMSSFDSILKQLDAKAEEMQALSLRVYHEVDEWEKCDSNTTKNNFLRNYINNILDVSVEDVSRLTGTLMIISGLTAGTYYPGEVIIKGSHSLKETVGFFPTLTHVRADHIPNTFLKSAIKGVTPLEIGLAVLDFGGKAVEDWGNYDRGTEKATAIALDAAFVAIKTVGIHYAGYALATVATGALVAVGAPAVAVAAAGIAVWWGVSYFGGKALDTGFETFKDDLVHGGGKLLDQAGVAIGNAANEFASATKQAANFIDNAFGGFKSTLLSII